MAWHIKLIVGVCLWRPERGSTKFDATANCHYRKTLNFQEILMEDLTSEHLEHAEHAEHAAHEGNPFIVTVSVTIAIIAVIAATVGRLESVESGKAINEKNEA